MIDPIKKIKEEVLESMKSQKEWIITQIISINTKYHSQDVIYALKLLIDDNLIEVNNKNKYQRKKSYCSCCGIPNDVYNEKGHDNECIWYEDEMYRLANEWKNSEDNVDWKQRYKLIVSFLLDQTNHFKRNLITRKM